MHLNVDVTQNMALFVNSMKNWSLMLTLMDHTDK